MSAFRRKSIDPGTAEHPPIDEKLWNEIQSVVPQTDPPSLPHYCGKIDSDHGGIEVHIVDGHHIMLNHDMDFESGGNGEEDPKLCGKHQILLDSNVKTREWPFNAMHEAVERRKMAKGASYDAAHVHANQIERQLRLRHGQGQLAQVAGQPGQQPGANATVQTPQ